MEQLNGNIFCTCKDKIPIPMRLYATTHSEEVLINRLNDINDDKILWEAVNFHIHCKRCFRYSFDFLIYNDLFNQAIIYKEGGLAFRSFTNIDTFDKEDVYGLYVNISEKPFDINLFNDYYHRYCEKYNIA